MIKKYQDQTLIDMSEGEMGHLDLAVVRLRWRIIFLTDFCSWVFKHMSDHQTALELVSLTLTSGFKAPVTVEQLHKRSVYHVGLA